MTNSFFKAVFWQSACLDSQLLPAPGISITVAVGDSVMVMIIMESTVGMVVAGDACPVAQQMWVTARSSPPIAGEEVTASIAGMATIGAELPAVRCR